MMRATAGARVRAAGTRPTRAATMTGTQHRMTTSAFARGDHADVTACGDGPLADMPNTSCRVRGACRRMDDRRANDHPGRRQAASAGVREGKYRRSAGMSTDVYP
jgi:hypothetical protein